MNNFKRKVWKNSKCVHVNIVSWTATIKYELNKNKINMESYEKFEKIMDEGFSKEDLWDEIVQFLSEDQLLEFADHFMTINDMDVEED